MSVASRPVTTGKTRTCPHCKATILESLSICPGCMHHLRFDSEAAKRQVAAAPALRVEGIIRHPPLEPPLEYFVIIAIRNDRGEEVTRQVVNVGALQAAEKRTFTLSVEVLPPQAPIPPQKSNSSTGTFKTQPPPPQPGATIRPPPAPAGATSAGSAPASTSTAGTYPASGSAPGASLKPASTIPKAPPTPASTTIPTSPRLTPQTTPPAPPTSSSNPNAPKPPPLNNPQGPASSTQKPQAGYPGGLKPPNPGGPKRH
jgi:hypothetical protein